MNNLPDVQKSTQELNSSSLQHIFGNDSYVSSSENGRYQVTSALRDSMTEGGQNMRCTLHREMVTVKVNEHPQMTIAWVLDELSTNDVIIIPEKKSIKILVSDDPYSGEVFEATLANLEMESIFQANTDERQIYVQSQVNSMDSVVSLSHELKHFETINEFTPQQIDLMKKYGSLKYQIDLLLFQHVQESGVVPDLNECETIRAKYFQELTEKLSEIEVADLKYGAKLIFQNEVVTNQETWRCMSDNVQNLFAEDQAGNRLKKYLTVVSLSYARTINGLFGAGTVDPNQAEIH